MAANSGKGESSRKSWILSASSVSHESKEYSFPEHISAMHILSPRPRFWALGVMHLLLLQPRFIEPLLVRGYSFAVMSGLPESADPSPQSTTLGMTPTIHMRY